MSVLKIAFLFVMAILPMICLSANTSAGSSEGLKDFLKRRAEARKEEGVASFGQRFPGSFQFMTRDSTPVETVMVNIARLRPETAPQQAYQKRLNRLSGYLERRKQMRESADMTPMPENVRK
jgi:hypothetical protein